ncbi:MAG: hypothetical protein Q8873_01800 [Bacillota bacterium]|nr:hypothetical protein [Bacillota bacterium]
MQYLNTPIDITPFSFIVLYIISFIISYVTENTIGERGFYNFSVAGNYARGENITYTINGDSENIANIVRKICIQQEWGFDVTPEANASNHIQMDIVLPRDNTSLIFSEKKRNLLSYNYTKDALESNNIVLNTCKGSGFEGSLYTNKSGYNCFSIAPGNGYFSNGTYFETTEAYNTRVNTDGWRGYYAIRDKTTNAVTFGEYDLGKEDTINKEYFLCNAFSDVNGKFNKVNNKGNIVVIPYYKTIEQPTGYLRRETGANMAGTDKARKDEAYNTLADKSIKEDISPEVGSDSGYKTKWNIGDYVTVEANINGSTVSMVKQITEVEEVYERNNIKFTPTFGEKKESILRKIIKGRI